MDEASHTLKKQSEQSGRNGPLLPATRGKVAGTDAAKVPWSNLIRSVPSFLVCPIIDGTLDPKKYRNHQHFPNPDLG